MSKVQSWAVSDSFWERVAPLIPPVEREAGREYRRKPGGGRRPMPPRQVFEAIMYFLRTGCQWKALPRERFGSAGAVHATLCDGCGLVFSSLSGEPVLRSTMK